jgi:hypothetical protein
MRVEVQGFLDKMLFHPVYYHEIPEELRSLILESLSAYKDRVGQPTGKARVLVDGSKQLDEIVGDSYCPVARNETVMVVLAVAAHRKWRVGSKSKLTRESGGPRTIHTDM